MFGLIKKFFAKPERPATPFAPPAAAAASPAPAAFRAYTPAVAAPASASPAPAMPANPSSVAGCLGISVGSLLPGLPENLRQRLTPLQGARLFIPKERVLPQLAQGAIVFRFDELCRLAPAMFDGIANYDAVDVHIPLAEVLPQLKPADYPRQSGQRIVSPPEEVLGLFGQKGQQVTIAKTILKEEPPKPAPLPPPPAPKKEELIPGETPQAAKVPTMAAVPPRAPQLLPTMPKAPSPVAPPPPPIAVSVPSPPSAPSSEVLRVPLAEVASGWPNEVARELAGLNVSSLTVAVPINFAEEALKSGQVLFPWKQLRHWIDATVPAPSPATGEMLVELPLKVMAPLFMARYRPAAPQKKINVGEDIPNLFDKSERPLSDTEFLRRQNAASPPPPAAPAVAPAPLPSLRMASPAPAPVPAPVPVSEPKVDLEAIMGPSGHRFPARDIVQNTPKIPGVLGAMLVMSDGLLVTSAVPPPIKSELVAAFIPQIFGRMGQYTRELNMGSLRWLSFTVEGGSWMVIKQTDIYLAVLCRPDRLVPQNQLAALAAELNTQQQ